MLVIAGVGLILPFNLSYVRQCNSLQLFLGRSCESKFKLAMCLKMFNPVSRCEFFAVTSTQMDNNLSKEIISYFLSSSSLLLEIYSDHVVVDFALFCRVRIRC